MVDDVYRCSAFSVVRGCTQVKMTDIIPLFLIPHCNVRPLLCFLFYSVRTLGIF